MKKRYLKKWVENMLVIINLISLVMLGSDSDKYFFTIHLTSLVIFVINCLILKKYSKLVMEV